MKNIAALTLGEIVKHDYKAAQVFEKFGLDFCCRGNQNFSDACTAGGIEPSTVLNELQQVKNEKVSLDFDTWPLDFLVDYICTRHHTYVEEKTPILKAYLDKLVSVHGGNHPELKQIRDIFFEIGGELSVHMKKEELMLFPFIKKIQKAIKNGTTASSPVYSTVASPVQMMMDDHTVEGDKFKKISSLTNHYQPPTDACATYAVTYQLLKEYEEDLHFHIHLENNILFPKATAFEKEIN